MNNITPHLPKGIDQTWAFGCSKCRYGIVSAPELTRACPLYLERIVQMGDKQIQFCECRAGVRYHAFLFNTRQKLIEEARRDPSMAYFAGLGTHPEIAGARRAIAESYAMMPPPTVHFVAAPAAAETHSLRSGQAEPQP